MGFFDAVGKAFGDIGRWGEKQRMALYYGSDWEDVRNRQQAFLDAYVANKRKAEAQDEFRKRAEFEWKKADAEDRQRANARKATEDAMSVTEQVLRAGRDPSELDPAIYADTMIPKDAIIAAAGEKIGRDKQAEAEKAQKAKREEESARILDALHVAQTNRANRPEKEERPDVLTDKQAFDVAQAALEAERKDPETGIKRPVSVDDIRALAAELKGGQGRDVLGLTAKSVGSLVPRGTQVVVPPGMAKGVNPSEVAKAGPVNPVKVAATKQATARLTPEQTATLHKNPQTGEMIYWNGQAWVPVP